jgi:hypothetical protein
MGVALAAARKFAEERQVSSSEVEGEFSRLKAENPDFNTLIAQVEALMLQKAALAELEGKVVPQIAALAGSINTGICAIDAMGREKSSRPRPMNTGCSGHMVSV